MPRNTEYLALVNSASVLIFTLQVIANIQTVFLNSILNSSIIQCLPLNFPPSLTASTFNEHFPKNDFTRGIQQLLEYLLRLNNAAAFKRFYVCFLRLPGQ